MMSASNTVSILGLSLVLFFRLVNLLIYFYLRVRDLCEPLDRAVVTLQVVVSALCGVGILECLLQSTLNYTLATLLLVLYLLAYMDWVSGHDYSR